MVPVFWSWILYPANYFHETFARSLILVFHTFDLACFHQRVFCSIVVNKRWSSLIILFNIGDFHSTNIFQIIAGLSVCLLYALVYFLISVRLDMEHEHSMWVWTTHIANNLATFIIREPITYDAIYILKSQSYFLSFWEHNLRLTLCSIALVFRRYKAIK